MLRPELRRGPGNGVPTVVDVPNSVGNLKTVCVSEAEQAANVQLTFPFIGRIGFRLIAAAPAIASDLGGRRSSLPLTIDTHVALVPQ